NIAAIGLMSGTSLDGLDIVAVNFKSHNAKWSFEIYRAETISYSKKWLDQLQKSPTLSGENLSKLHSEYGNYIGLKTIKFIKRTGFKPELIASHGHTVFHQPQKGFTLQIGNGAEIAAITKIQTVADFRVTDVALGGQGAPLVPIGDQLLFSDYEYCLNLGGFANVSYHQNNQRIAYDICPVNFVLNRFAKKNGLAYDRNGALGKQGKIHSELLKELNGLRFYSQNPPKSLGREWIEKEFYPILNSFPISDLDKLRTIYEHISIQISKITSKKGKMLITGGGAFNTFLKDRMIKHSSIEPVIPDAEIINFKEALIFAFLGVLRINNKINCLSSVTGASKDSSCGVIYSA
ncbi:anhydro-N-acetylmuramic acid kinase, partial [Draconibacterium sp.]|nr:anhydro-N-acetylmuramic acid kinase [Draconibacterium sp.]